MIEPVRPDARYANAVKLAKIVSNGEQRGDLLADTTACMLYILDKSLFYFRGAPQSLDPNELKALGLAGEVLQFNTSGPYTSSSFRDSETAQINYPDWLVKFLQTLLTTGIESPDSLDVAARWVAPLWEF